MVGIVRRAPDVDEKVKVSCFLFVTGRQRSHVGTAFIQWRYIAPINVKFGAAENVPHFTFTMFNVQRSQFFFYFGHKFVNQRRLVCTIFYEILSVCTLL